MYLDHCHCLLRNIVREMKKVCHVITGEAGLYIKGIQIPHQAKFFADGFTVVNKDIDAAGTITTLTFLGFFDLRLTYFLGTYCSNCDNFFFHNEIRK